MVRWVGRRLRQQSIRWVFAATAAAASLAVLPGCATNSASAGDPNAGVITPSDEPETRRRARIRLELAVNYFQNGQTAVALDEVKQALAADPNYADAYNLRGLIYMRLNDLGQAEDSFKRALALRGSDSDLMHNYGVLLCQQKKYAEADQLFVRALANPTYQNRVNTFITRGLCQSSAGTSPRSSRAGGRRSCTSRRTSAMTSWTCDDAAMR